jgi:hypothetical protein
MLFKTLGYITSLGNIAVLLAIYYNDTFINFGSPHWNIALGSMVFLSVVSISFFYLNNQKHGINALKMYGSIYAFMSLIIYGYWSIKNLYLEISFKEFKGLFFLFSTLILVSLLSIGTYMKEGNGKLLILIANILSVLTVTISFATIYKYVFLQSPFKFDALILELFTIFVGSILFLGAYIYGKKHA